MFYDHLYSDFKDSPRTMESLKHERLQRKLRRPILELIALRAKHGIHAR